MNDPSQNIFIAPPSQTDNSFNTFNPTAITAGDNFSDIFSDTSSDNLSENDSQVTNDSHTRHVNQVISHILEEHDRTEPGRSESNPSQQAKDNLKECQICYNQFDINTIVNTPCNHVFCSPCFFRWLKGNVSCAMCRNDFTSWGRHSSDNFNDDLTSVTEMFNATLREHVHLNKLNNKLISELSKMRFEKNMLMTSLISSRNLINYNKGYAKGLHSMSRPETTGNKDFDNGLIDGYYEFKSLSKKTKNDAKEKFKNKFPPYNGTFVFKGNNR